MKIYNITYFHEFNGDITEHTYQRTVKSESELENVIENLYSDSHILMVDYELVEE